MARYKAYPEYKDSGVEWLGKIPGHWEAKRLGQFFEERRDKVSDKDYPALSVTMQGIVPQLENAAKTDAGDNRKLVLKNDFVINSRSDRKGSSGVSPYDGSVSLIAIVMIPRRVIPAYAHHLLRSQPFQEEFYRYGKGIVADLWSTNSSEMKNILIPKIPDQEAKTIANFLDHETAKIDTLIEEQQSLIRLLQEKRQAVISHVVAARPDEKVARLSYFIDLLPGYAFPSKGYKDTEEGNIKLLRGINIGVGYLKWDEVAYWRCSELEDLEAFQLHEGDIVFGMDRPWISSGARVAEVKAEDLPCLLLQRVARIRAGQKTFQPFIKMCLQSIEFKKYVESDLTGVSVPHISPEQIKGFGIRDISFEQQESETKQALEQISRIERIVIQAQDAIQLMQERRTALISAAVTGKIDVRDWVAPSTQNQQEQVPEADI
ncbi:MAG: hypothetical protein OIF57_08345 [Marinobacterium sp.]|nr:hypothetical protein [Marinobacterium sp.]